MIAASTSSGSEGNRRARGLIVSAPGSHAGKTTITLALLAALRRRGVAVRAAKSGPDYIDPAFHAAATGTASVNLDSWAMRPALIEALVAEAMRDADLLVIEGAMGLFDGVGNARGRTGAVADLAEHFGFPVLLVLDVGGQSQSAAAVAAGFASFRPAVSLCGVVLNKLGSERHRSLILDGFSSLGIPVLGAFHRDQTAALPERHLGLVQAHEYDDLDTRLKRLADIGERCLDIDAIVGAAAPSPRGSASPTAPALAPPGQRIALASDAAFTFTYPHVLAAWRRAGVEIVPFSPLAGEGPPSDCDVCWLPGGYPELFAGRLAGERRFHDGLAEFARTRPVYGECGGYMVLGEALEDADGVSHRMAGLLGHVTSFARRKLHLGYREGRLRDNHPLGAAGDVLRGHEFHYASIVAKSGDAPFLDITDVQGRRVDDGASRRGLVSGTFFHVIAREC